MCKISTTLRGGIRDIKSNCGFSIRSKRYQKEREITDVKGKGEGEEAIEAEIEQTGKVNDKEKNIARNEDKSWNNIRADRRVRCVNFSVSAAINLRDMYIFTCIIYRHARTCICVHTSG